MFEFNSASVDATLVQYHGSIAECRGQFFYAAPDEGNPGRLALFRTARDVREGRPTMSRARPASVLVAPKWLHDSLDSQRPVREQIAERMERDGRPWGA